MTSSKILFFLCLSFIAGIFLESLIKIPQAFVWGILILGVIFIFLCLFTRRISFVIGFCVLVLVFGILRTQISEFNIANDKLSQFNGKGQVVFTGIIFGEPDVRDTSQLLKIRVLSSTVLVTTGKYPEYKYLDKVKITGKLETPSQTGDGATPGSYKNFLMKDHIYSVAGFPRIELISENSGHDFFSYLYEKILFFKQKIRISIQNNFLPPQRSILEGTILGDNGAMTNDLKSKLNITGLRHIVAVSGTHVVILSSLVMSLLLAAGFWRRQAFYIAIVFICVYIVLTGLPSSGIRAGIMGGIYLLSQQLGRQTMAPRLIVLACAIMLLINPLLLIYDVGFQLSFIAVAGLIYLEPLIKKLINFLANQKAKNLTGIISTTIAAQIFTLPIMIYNFGNISFVSPITNFLVLPVVYWLMVLGFLVSVVGIFSSVIGWILSIPCWLLLTYFVKVMDFFSQPWMAKSITNVSWVWVFVYYFIIGCAIRLINKRYSQDFL